MDKLQKSLFEFNDSLEKSYPIIPGEIGISLGGSRITEVPGRGQFVYVRLRSNQSEIIQVFNGKVFPGYGLPVLVQWHNNRYEIIGVDVQRYQQWLADNPHIAKHGATHSMDKEGDRLGTDPVWVYPYQFMPSLVAPFPQSGILNAYINPLMIQYGGQWKYLGNTGTSSLTTYNPVSGSSIVLISLDASTGNPYMYATTGTYIPSSVTGTSALLGYLPGLDLGRYIPLSFVLLASGTSGITWDNLFDVRQFFTPPPSGTILFVQDEGVPRGLVSTLNFVGDNIDLTVSGTVGRVFVTGSSGGSSLNFQDEGVPLGVPGTVNFVGGNVDVTVSGTVARVFVTGTSLLAGQNTYISSTGTVSAVGIVKNTSGATANAGDVGYINQAGEYKTTSTANYFDNLCTVIVGGVNNSDIYVADKGRVFINYTGTAPTPGHFLSTSVYPGLAQRQTTMRPDIFAVCLNTGTSGVVSALLLCDSKFVAYTSSNDVYRSNSHSQSIFTATINGAPSATSVVYNAPSAGQEDVLPPAAAGQLALLVLWNTTRGTARLVTACNVGTNTITTVSSTDAWANGDTIVIADQTILDSVSPDFAGFDISQQTEIPLLARNLVLSTVSSDTGGATANQASQFHTYESYTASKVVNSVNIYTNTHQTYGTAVVPLFQQRFGKRELASGTGVKLTILKIVGYWLASP